MKDVADKEEKHTLTLVVLQGPAASPKSVARIDEAEEDGKHALTLLVLQGPSNIS